MAAMVATGTDSPTVTCTHYVGRQPILDAQQKIFGYELLFRSSLDNTFAGEPDTATRRMIDNVLLFGLDTLAPGARAFVNCTREALTRRLVTSLPPEMTVLEITADVYADAEVVAACRDLKQRGYQLALDNYLPNRGADGLLPLVDYIKLDFRANCASELREIRRQRKELEVKFIAEKVETDLEFRYAQAEGYDYFQGYFFSRPTFVQRREIPASHILYLQLLSAISRTPWDQREVERLVMAEASLCFRVLRLVNSPVFALRSPITSIGRALLMIGEDEFRKLVTVASATTFGARLSAPSELILMALHRARFCELLAPVSGQFQGEQYLIGLLSAFDAILQIPTSEILETLPLRPEAAAALLGEQGPVGVPIRLFLSYEKRQWTQCARVCKTLGLTEGELTSIYLAALEWASKEVRKAGS